MKAKNENLNLSKEKEENIEIQSTEVTLAGEEENLGIGYEIVISSESRWINIENNKST